MGDTLALVRKDKFKRRAHPNDQRAGGGPLPWKSYGSRNPLLAKYLGRGDRLFLVTVHPPNERLWLVSVLKNPSPGPGGWRSKRKNKTPVVDITSLRSRLRFSTGNGLTKEKGKLGNGLQTPRLLAPGDVMLLDAAIENATAGAAQPQNLAHATRALKSIGPLVSDRIGMPEGWEQGSQRYTRPPGDCGSYGYVDLLTTEGAEFCIWLEYARAFDEKDLPMLGAAFTATGRTRKAIQNLARREGIRSKPYGVLHRERPEAYFGEPIVEKDHDGYVHLTRYVRAGDYDVANAACVFARFFEDWNARIADSLVPAFAIEGRISYVTRLHKSRERGLREKKIRQFKSRHKGRLFCEVPRCGFEFEAAYGIEFAEVHHLDTIAARCHGTRTYLNDLMIVCSNCHSIIHSSKVVRDPETLIV